MSTTTPNYGLVKPQLTDAADITAMNPNWDKIDEELKDLEEAFGDITPEGIGARPNTWTPTASDVGALPIGGGTLTDGIRFSNSYGNFGEVDNQGQYGLKISDTLDGKTDILNVRGGYGTPIYQKVGYKSGQNGNFDLLGTHNYKNHVLPLDGSVPMSGVELKLNNGYGGIHSWHWGTSTIARSEQNGTERREIQIYPPSKYPVSTGVRVNNIDADGNLEDYFIYGEHNVTKGTTDIGAGSAMTSLIHLVYEE